MKKWNALLVFLISSIAITGISFIDGKIWEVIFLIVGMISYAIVGTLFSIGILSTKQNGRDAYALVFSLLILAGYGFYRLLRLIRDWILSWPLFAKIIVAISIGLALLAGIILVIAKIVKEKKKQNGQAKETDD